MSRVGHVIPPGNLLPICLCKGPSGGEFEFTYQLRNAPAMVRTYNIMCMVLKICAYKVILSDILVRVSFFLKDVIDVGRQQHSK